MTTRNATTTARNAASKAKAEAENAVDTAVEKTEAMASDAQKTMNEQFDKVSKNLEGLTAFGQENVDAMVKSSEIAAKAAEGIGQEVTAYSKKSFDDGVAAAQDMASAKTMTELFEKQTAFVQNSMESLMQQASKMNEMMAAAAKDITAPLQQRFNAATDAVKSMSF